MFIRAGGPDGPDIIHNPISNSIQWGEQRPIDVELYVWWLGYIIYMWIDRGLQRVGVQVAVSKHQNILRGADYRVSDRQPSSTLTRRQRSGRVQTSGSNGLLYMSIDRGL